MTTLTEYRRLAEAATKGPWESGRVSVGRIGIYADTGYRVATVHDFNGWPVNESNGAFIAALNPAAVLKMLEVVEKAKEVVSAANVNESGDPYWIRLYDSIRALRASLESLEKHDGR